MNIQKQVELGLSLFRATVPMRGSDWADKHFYLSPESSGIEGKWKCYPYQIAILNWMTSDDITYVSIAKSRRVGYTKCAVAAIASFIAQKKRNVSLWQPRDTDAKEFVVDEIDTMIRDVPIMSKLLKCDIEKKSKWNTVTKKVFYGATLHIKGGTSPAGFRRITVDVAVLDELSGFEIDIGRDGGEGSARELAEGRLDGAPFPKLICGSTPKSKGACQIEKAVNSSDMIFYRFVKCCQCGLLQNLELSRLEWDGEDTRGTTRYACKSGCAIKYGDFAEMDLNGRWQTLDGKYYVESEDQFYDENDQRIEKPDSIGVKISALYSYLKPWSYVASKYHKAKKAAQRGDITLLKTFTNTLAGETFEETGEKINSSDLSKRGEGYLKDGTIPEGVIVITVGVDVQGGPNPRIELEFVGWGVEKESWSLDYVVIGGDATQGYVWSNLDTELLRKFVRKDGAELQVAAAFVDSGYLSTHVYRFTGKRRHRNIYSTKGVNSGLLCNKGTWQGEQKNDSRAILHTVNVDDAKEILFGSLKINKPGPGYCHFPDHYTDEYFQQLTNEEKREKRKNGIVIGFEWVPLGPNEAMDCRNYARGALERLNVNMTYENARLKLQSEYRKSGHDPGIINQRVRRVRSVGLRGS